MSTLERLRASDPARDLDPTPPEDLLRAIVTTPRQPRKRRRAALALVPVTAAAVAALLLAPTDSTELAARAYAQTAPQADSILYVRTTMHTLMDTRGERRQETSSRERWQQGGRWHSILHHQGQVFEEVRGADGVLRFSDGETARREDGGDAEDYIDRSAPGFLASFRQAYENGRLDESGDARFAGRAAKRYVVEVRGNRSEYYLDAETGMPLGSRQRMIVYSPKIGPDRRPTIGEPIGFHLMTETVEALEQLPSTPENLAKLTGSGS